MTYADIVTSGGVFFILVAFLLSTFNVVNPKSLMYYGMNLVGGGLAFYGSILIDSIPFAIMEGTWTVVAIIGLFTARRTA